MTRLHIKAAADRNLALCGVWTRDFVVVGAVYESQKKPLCKNCLKIALSNYGRQH